MKVKVRVSISPLAFTNTKKVGTHLVHHNSGHGPADLHVLAVAALGPQQEEDESCGQRHLRQVTDVPGLAQPDEGHHLVAQVVQLADPDVGRLSTTRDLAHEVHVELCKVSDTSVGWAESTN